MVGVELLDVRYVSAHVELAARIHAASAEPLERGEYTLRSLRPAPEER